MGLAPLNTPLHAKPRSSRSTNNAPIPIPGPSAQSRRFLSPTSEETLSPRAENLSASPIQRPLSSNLDYGELVEEVMNEPSEEEGDESFILGHELLASIGRRNEEGNGLGWRGWLGVAAFGVIGGGVFLIAGQTRKEPKPSKRSKFYSVHQHSYYGH